MWLHRHWGCSNMPARSGMLRLRSAGSDQAGGLAWRRTVTDLEVENNLVGMLVAALSVVSSGMQQIFCRSMQQKHGLSSHELLANTAPAQVTPGLPSCAQARPTHDAEQAAHHLAYHCMTCSEGRHVCLRPARPIALGSILKRFNAMAWCGEQPVPLRRTLLIEAQGHTRWRTLWDDDGVGLDAPCCGCACRAGR